MASFRPRLAAVGLNENWSSSSASGGSSTFNWSTLSMLNGFKSATIPRSKTGKVELSSTASSGTSSRSPYWASSASSSCSDGATEHKLAVSEQYITMHESMQQIILPFSWRQEHMQTRHTDSDQKTGSVVKSQMLLDRRFYHWTAQPWRPENGICGVMRVGEMISYLTGQFWRPENGICGEISNASWWKTLSLHSSTLKTKKWHLWSNDHIIYESSLHLPWHQWPPNKTVGRHQ